MKPAPLRYERAESVQHALEFLASEGERAKVLAGGQSLVALLNLRLARPEIVLDIGPLDELRHHGRANGALEVGAMTTQRELERESAVADACSLLAAAIPYVGHEAIRNRGTIGGTIAHADPAAELPVVLAALGGSVRLRSTEGEHTVEAKDFFKSFLMTAARPDELLVSVSFPATGERTATAFEEFARRPGDFALVSIACAIERDDDGSVRSARMALGGVASAPLRLEGLDALAGGRGQDVAAAAADIAERAIDPVADVHGSAEYRRHLARELVKRAVVKALDGGS
jgi:aerobic carbon-monoxide dehydrogenase medium subunit